MIETAPKPSFTKMLLVMKYGAFVRAMAVIIMSSLVGTVTSVPLGVGICALALTFMSLEYLVYKRLHKRSDEIWPRAAMLAVTVLAAFAFVMPGPVLLSSAFPPAVFSGGIYVATILIYQALYYSHSRVLAIAAVLPIAAVVLLCLGEAFIQSYAADKIAVAVIQTILVPAYFYALYTMKSVIDYRAGKLRHMTKKAQEANIAKSEFLANMSHEIRTPMNGIVAMADMLQSSDLNATQRKYADIITSSGESLLVIINDILDLSKLEARQMELDPAPFDLVSLVEDIADLIAVNTANDVDVASFVDPILPRFLIGDSLRLRQILLNMASNASKFTESGSILISVTGGESGGDRRVSLQFRVHDTGIGIEADRLDHMFEAFSQATTGTTKLYGGTGLGLSICKDLVRLMGGTVFAESQVGKGSTFGFDVALPIDEAGQPDLSELLSGQTVAILTRSPALYGSLEKQLSRYGAMVEARTPPASVLKGLIRDQNRPDVTIVDHRLQSGDGTGLAEWMQTYEAKLGTRVLVLGGDNGIALPVRSSALIEVFPKAASSRLTRAA